MSSEFPPQFLGTVLAVWHLFHCGFANPPNGESAVTSPPELEFTPQDLERALLESNPEEQSSLLVAIHVTLIKLISRSAQGANTVTWRTTMARILSYGGGSRVRNRLRTLQVKYEKLPSLSTTPTEEDEGELELGAIFGAIALHPFFSDDVKRQLLDAAKAEDVFDEAQSVLAPYGKTSVDSLALLLNEAKFQQRKRTIAASAPTTMDIVEDDDLAATATSTTTNTLPSELTKPPRYHNMHKKNQQLHQQAQEKLQQEGEQESFTERSIEEAERICQALIQFEITEYSALPLETKCFILDYLIEYFMDSKHVRDLMETALEETAQLEGTIEQLELAHQELELASQPRQVAFILNALRERMRVETLRKIFAEDWQAKHDKSGAAEEQSNAGSNGEEDEEADAAPVSYGRGGRRLNPDTYIGKTINRSMFNITRQAKVVSYDAGMEKFRIEYDEDEAGLFEYLTVAEVRKPVHARCTDEQFVNLHVSDLQLKQLTQEQLVLVREHFANMGGARKDRQLAVDRLDELDHDGDEENKICVGATVECDSFGRGFCLSVDKDFVHVQFVWGGVGSLQPSCVHLAQEPVHSREAFLQESSEQLEEIALQKQRFARYTEMLRFSPSGKQDNAWVFPKPNTLDEFVLLCPDPQSDERGEIRSFTGLDFPHPHSELVPPREFDLPFWLLPEALQQKVHDGVLTKTEASKPNTLTRLLLGRLQSDLEPWLAKPAPVQDLPYSLQASKQKLLDLEANLMQGLAEMSILKHFAKPAESVVTPSEQPASREAGELLQRPAEATPPERPPFTLKNQGSRFRTAKNYREIISSYATVEEAWKESNVQLIQSLIWDDVSSAQLIFTSLDAFWQQEVCEKWQKLCEARTSLQSAHAADTKQFSLDPAVAACSDAALVFLLRWLDVRKKWRNRIMQHTASFSELAGCAVSLERASFELRRAGASADLARDQVFRKNSRACYFPSLHKQYMAQELLHLPSVTPHSALLYNDDGGKEPKILRIRRVDLHRDFYYLALQTTTLVEDDEEDEAEDEDQQDAEEEEVLPTLTPRKRPSLAMFSSGSDSDHSDSEAVDSNGEDNDDDDDGEERRRQAQIEIDQNGRETSVHTRRPWYHYKIKPRLRLSVACIEDGCEKNAVESNMGYCEDHRTVKKRGRPIGSTSVKKKKPQTAKQRQQQANQQQHHDEDEDADFPPSRRSTAAIQATPEIDESGAALAAAAANEDRCYVCLTGGELVCCDFTGCAKAYHQKCLLQPAPTEKSADAPWHCPMHALPMDSREYRVTKSLTNVLDAIAELDSAHLIAGNAQAEPRAEADDLISIRRKLILHHAYTTFEEMHQDANRLRRRFHDEAQATGDTALELAVERLWKNFKVRISRAKNALDGGPIREPRERTMQSGTKILRSSYANQYQAKVIQYDAASRLFFDGEALDANGFFEPIEQNQPIRPGKVMFNLGYAQELCKSSHWPTSGTKDRLERMGTINKSGKRLKMDDFASVEDFEVYADETLMVVRRDAPYLQTEKAWKRAQLESQTQQYVDDFKRASEAYLNAVREFEEWKQKAVNAWSLICRPRDTWSQEQYNYMQISTQHFGALAQRFNVPRKPSPAMLLEQDEAPAAAAAAETGAGARPSPLVVNLVWNQRRLARPSNQRLVGLVNLKRPDRWFDSVKVGDRVFVKLNPKADLFGWPAETVSAELGGGELILGIRFEHDHTERRVHEGVRASEFLVRNPMHDQPDTGLQEGVKVAVVIGTQVKAAMVKKLEEDRVVVVPDGTSAAAVDESQQVVVHLNQVRSMSWVHAAIEQGRLQQQQLHQQQAATPGIALYNKQRAVKRDTLVLVNVHVKRAGIEVAQLPATFPSTAHYDSDTFDIGDYVDVHILQHQTWKLGQVLARVSTNVLQVKTVKDGKVFQVDKRLVRKPQRKQEKRS